MSRTRSALAACAALLSVAESSPARADFDPATGRVDVGSAYAQISFDSADELSSLGSGSYFNFNLQSVVPGTDDFLTGDEETIEGTGALRLSTNLSGFAVAVDGFGEDLRGRRVEIRMWYRAEGSYPVAELVYAPISGVEALGDQATFFAPLAVVRLQPTGRATDDGWVEISTGPVDYHLTGALEARVLRVFDARLWDLALFRQTALVGSARLDGLEILDLGPAAQGDQVCSRAAEAATCGAGGVCLVGHCVDGKPLLGNLPPAGSQVRSDYLARQAFRLAAFNGGRVPQANMRTLGPQLNALAGEEDLVRFWSRYRRIYDDVADGHLSEPSFDSSVLGGGGGDVACIYQGEIDRLPGETFIGDLVFEVDPQGPLAGRIQAGDVLRSIDGLSVDDWVALSDRDLRYGGDPRARRFVVTPDILDSALRAGSTLRFERCAFAERRCTAAEVETIEIDGAALSASLRQGQTPLWWRQAGVQCDFRFREPVGLANRGGGRGTDRVAWSDITTYRSIIIDGVLGVGQWREDARGATANLPEQVLIDQRTGVGGTFDGIVALTAPFLPANATPGVQVFPQVSPALTSTTQAQFVRCERDLGGECGNFFQLSLQDPNPPSRVPNARVAVLNGRDVSGNDYLSRTLRDRTTGQTRIFGAVPTYGAFGPVLRFPRILDEILGGSMQLQDTIFRSGSSDPNLDFTTGIGIPPDEVVYQRQSDALAGRDTLINAAASWLTGGN